MKKKVLSVLLALCMTVSLAACGNDSGQTGDSGNAGGSQNNQGGSSAVSDTSGTSGENNVPAGELVDGKFTETRHIVVEIYDRGNDGGSDPTNNMYTDYIKKGMLEDHNVEVEFKAVPRWTEVEEINNLLAASDAPDICLTYDYATIQTYANMGGVIDLAPYVDNYKDLLPNLWNWLGDANINYDRDPNTNTLWAIEGKRADIKRINCFVRRDWLEALNMDPPTTTQEFEDMLVAFRDNASTLLGSDANKMVPFSISYDVGWRAANLIESFIDPNISEREYYVNGFDDRKLTQNGTKEAIRLLNKWYNDGLIWKDFALYSSGDSTEDDMIKAGYVGAFIHNWDYPFRNGEDSIQANLQRLVGDDAAFIAVDCFQDSNGNYSKYSYSAAGDRKLFFPITNDEPLASMLYLDWISDPEHIQYLQIGDEGVTHDVLEDGAIAIKAAEGNAIMNSGQNIDMTITCNGLHLMDDTLTTKSAAHNYSSVDPELVINSINIAMNDIITPRNVQVGEITAESGMGTVLSEKRDIVYDNAVIASPDNFDKVWDDGIADYLNAGGQDIMDERNEKWEATFGNTDMMP